MLLNTRSLVTLVALLTLPCLTGCSTSLLNMSLSKTPKVEQETTENPVIKMIPAWQESEGPGIGNQAIVRGFGCQIYFITNKTGMPSLVNGSIKVYLFDDLGTAEEQAKPIHTFDFPPESLRSYGMMTKLGPTYSIFIPYTRPGRHLAQCALRIRYTPPTGPAIYSEMSSITLPGAKREIPESERPQTDGPRVDPDGTMTLGTPSKPDSKGFKTTNITQVAAEEEPNFKFHTQSRSSLQTADFEASADDFRTTARVRLADHEADADDGESGSVETTSSFADEIPDEKPSKSYSIPLD